MNPNTTAGSLPAFGTASTAAPAFSFGTSTTNSGSSFGSLGTTATPSLSFGATTTPSFGLGTTTTSGLFGTSGGFGSLTAKPATTTASTTGFSFGQPAPTTTTAPVSAPSFAGLSTGFSGLSATTSAPASTGFSLTTTTASAPAPSFSLTSTSTPQTGFSLGLTVPASTTSTTTAATGFSLSSTAPVSTGFSLNLGTTTASTTQTSSLTLSAALGSVASTSASGTTPATAAPKSMVNFSQLDDTIHKWTLELVELERLFVNQMDQVRDWDRLLLSTGDKIVTLNDSMQKVKLRQQQLNHELDFIVAQQRELEECLIPLEKEFEDVTVSDPERNSVYQSAENLNTQLQQISDDLRGVIEHINEKNKSQDSNDPIAQIGRILNAHMNSLQWVDQNTSVIQQMLDQTSKMRDIYRRDIESPQNF